MRRGLMLLASARLMLVIALVFSALIGGLHLQPQVDHASAAFGACTMPCWQGVQPGITRREVALSLLTQATGLAPVISSCVSPVAAPCDLYRWMSPDHLISYAGLFVERGEITGVVAFSPGFTLGEALLALDPLSGADLGTVANNEFYAQLFFDHARIVVRAPVACPGTFHELMDTPVSSVEVQSPDLNTQYIPAMKLADMRGLFYRICASALQ